jgi:hypothetical protein
VSFCVGATGLAMVRPGDDEAAGIPNPLGVEGLVEGSGSLSTVFGILVPASWAILSIAAAASLVVRFGRSRGKERQQLKWFVYALVICVLVNTAGQAFLNDCSRPACASVCSSSPSRACGWPSLSPSCATDSTT